MARHITGAEAFRQWFREGGVDYRVGVDIGMRRQGIKAVAREARGGRRPRLAVPEASIARMLVSVHYGC